MFEKASKLKLRFETAQGMVSVEDLWDLPLVAKSVKGYSLDNVAQNIHKKLRAQVESFVDTSANKSDEDQLRFDIILHIIGVKKKEAETAQQAQQNAQKKQKIMSIIEDKELESLRGTPVEDLRKLVESL